MTSIPNPPPHVQDDALGSPVADIPPLSPDSPASVAYDAFKANSALYAVAVVETGGRPIGLLNRFKFLETFSQPFAHDLFKRHTVATMMDTAPLMSTNTSRSTS